MIKINPEDSKAYNEKGECYFELKQYKFAILDLDQAINYNPKDADSYYLRGKSYECLGKPDLAIREFMDAAKLDHKKAQDELTKKGIKW